MLRDHVGQPIKELLLLTKALILAILTPTAIEVLADRIDLFIKSFSAVSWTRDLSRRAILKRMGNSVRIVEMSGLTRRAVKHNFTEGLLFFRSHLFQD